MRPLDTYTPRVRPQQLAADYASLADLAKLPGPVARAVTA
jgi:hypothetical protein